MTEFTKEFAAIMGNREGMDPLENSYITDFIWHYLNGGDGSRAAFIAEFPEYTGKIKPGIIDFGHFQLRNIPMMKESLLTPVTVADVINYLWDIKDTHPAVGWEFLWYLEFNNYDNEHAWCHLRANRIIASHFVAKVKPDTDIKYVRFYEMVAGEKPRTWGNGMQKEAGVIYN